MAYLSRASLTASIKNLLADVERLPENVLEDERGRQSILGQINQLRITATAPIERFFGEIIFQPHLTAAVKIALEGRWLEALADGKPKTAQDIASSTGAEPELIARIMMVLTANSIVDELGFQTYAITPVSGLLLDPGWANGVRHFFDHCGPSLINLPGYLERNGYKVPQDAKTGPFADAWGGKNTWALFEAEPARGDTFRSFMAKSSDGRKMWTDFYPVQERLCDEIERSEDAVLLVDVGGGVGNVLKDFVKESARKTGRLILQDQQAALGDADALKEQGIEVMAHDFFSTQPIKGAKAYLFRAILHDWPDRACLEILAHTAKAMRPGYSKLLINDMVLPDTGVPPIGAYLDLSMMALETGAERTSKQWHHLLETAGFRIERIWPAGLGSIIEAELVAKLRGNASSL